ncbi:MAG: hypothetical protein ACPMAQ_14130 [Phycisphaerae bacterium]
MQSDIREVGRIMYEPGANRRAFLGAALAGLGAVRRVGAARREAAADGAATKSRPAAVAYDDQGHTDRLFRGGATGV